MEKLAYIKNKIGLDRFADSNALYAKLIRILEASVKDEGDTNTVVGLNALTTPVNNYVTTLTTAGTLTLGTLAVLVGDRVYFNGTAWVKQANNSVVSPVVLVTDNKTLTAADSGKTFLIGTDAKTFNLPATAIGLRFRFINAGSAGNNIITVAPVAADGISGTIKLAASVVVDAGIVNKAVINTKATAQVGDTIELLGTGVTGTAAWIIVGSSGIWAAQA